MVCSMTRRPAKPISAPGSATLTSPTMASEAATPPVVGSVSTDTYGRPAARNRPSAMLTLAICIRDSTPSCIRAPPDAEKKMTGSRSVAACSTMRASFSPTAVPMLPPRNPKSKQPNATGRPSSVATPHTTASARPDRARAASRRWP